VHRTLYNVALIMTDKKHTPSFSNLIAEFLESAWTLRSSRRMEEREDEGERGGRMLFSTSI
jgi:hypothetical protein